MQQKHQQSTLRYLCRMFDDYPISAIAAGYRNLHHWHQHCGRESSVPSARKTRPVKTLLVGWDAADWQYIDPLLAEGKMPVLQSLLQRGARGQLASMHPMLSPMLWTTIATGKRPYAHGIHGFTEINEAQKIQPVSGRSRTAAAFWEILNHHDYRTQVVGWWPSHPAEPLKGQMVSNLFHHGDAPAIGFAWPESLSKPLQSCRIQPEWIPFEWVQLFLNNPGHPAKDTKTRAVMHILARALSVQMASTYLLHHFDTDLHAVYFDALDHFCHLGVREHRDEPKIVEAAYRLHDLMLGGLLYYCDEQTNVMLMSDHGFQKQGNMRDALPADDPLAPQLDHRYFGALVTAGPGFIQRKPIFGASIADITPSLLGLFSIPSSRDMHGRVLNDYLSNPTSLAPVDTYDHLRTTNNSTDIPSNYLDHLAALGYIDRDASNRKQQDENTVNLARSYMDGLQPGNALRVLEALIDKNTPLSTRMLYTQAAFQAGDVQTAEGQIEHFPGEWQPIVNAMLATVKGNNMALISALKQLPKDMNYPAGWLTLIGNLWLSAKQTAKAIQCFESATAKDLDATDAAFGLARALAANDQLEDALEHALEITEKQHFAPNVHAFIGKLLLRLKQPQQAYLALQLSIQQQPNNAELRAFLQQHFHTPTKRETPVIVVSGLPRSGTSLMMQILESLGVPVHTDKRRTPDAFNKGGYYEYDGVKRLHIDNRFLDDLQGKAIKITSPQLPNISRGATYNVIVMQRNIDQIVHSQLHMINAQSVPFNLQESLEATNREAIDFLNAHPHWTPYTVINFNKLVDEPEQQVRAICAFLNIPYNDNWKNIINPEWRRFTNN